MLINTFNPIQKIEQDSNGILLMYDTSRSNWIGVSRSNFYFGLNHNKIRFDSWMNVISSVPTNNNGYKIPRNGIITSITIQSKKLGTAIFEILRNSDQTSITTISLTNEISKTIDNLNIELNKDDFIQCYIKPDFNDFIDFPLLNLELAWR